MFITSWQCFTLLLVFISLSNTFPLVEARLVKVSLLSLVPPHNNLKYNMDSKTIPVASPAVNVDGNKGTSCDATTTTTRTDNTSTSTVTNTDHNAQQEHPLTMTNALTFLSTICGALKNIKRTGWVRMGVPLPESDADHMHRCAMCALMVTSQLPDPRDDYSGTNQIFHPSQINGSKLLKMALTHDLCESIAGDITPFCDAGAVASKYDKEKAAMEKIRDVVGDPLGTELFDLWEEYEEQRSPEALYCKDIDKFEMVLQAFEYEKAHLISKNDVSCCVTTSDETDSSSSISSRKKSVISEPMRTFYVTTSKKMKSPLFQRLDAELRTTREEMLTQRGWDVLLEEK